MVRMEEDVNTFAAPNWKSQGATNSFTDIPFTVVLKHETEALAKLDKAFWAVSDPTSPEYGKHLNIEGVTELVGVAKKATEVIDYLHRHGCTAEAGSNQDLVHAKCMAWQVEGMFNTKFETHTHTKVLGANVHRVVKPYHLPAHIAQHVAFISDIVRFPSLDRMANRRKPDDRPKKTLNQTPWPTTCGDSCDGHIIPDVLFKQYNITKGAVNAHGKNKMAVAEFQGQEYDQKDLDKFFDACGYKQQKVSKTTGGNSGSFLCSLGMCTEALLDIEYILALASPIPLEVYYDSTFSLFGWMKTILNDPEAPWVHSVSYGNDERQQISKAYMQSVDAQFQKIGVRGISILIASGDQGVWGRSGPGGKFNPDFPAGSAFVTAVGGTDLKTDVFQKEVGCKDGGGGFSDTFLVPPYQQEAVNQFKSISGSSLPAANLWNAQGRGYPDVAALFGDDVPYCISSGGNFEGVAGTSAACPVVAAQIAKLNDIRFHNNKPALGFLNPFLYQTAAKFPKSFNDITEGNNGSGGGAGTGFTAVKGWDPVTGLGSLNYGNLADVVQHLD